ncbi:hypothetical protein XELAEV_18014565mg [Xenopus laevis]|uniref:Uncharacterized protein n=1 Tax=Xenopus laevis TaxID=8355 RepID=A0A974DGA9_XENLA|nr:hypothetical protein XELAEV_18014565mg [Xenopus laevis]
MSSPMSDFKIEYKYSEFPLLREKKHRTIPTGIFIKSSQLSRLHGCIHKKLGIHRIYQFWIELNGPQTILMNTK